MEKTLRKVPELNLLQFVEGSPSDQAEFTGLLFSGLKEYGFINLVKHTVDQKLVDKAYKLSKTFFSLPNDIKDQYISPDGSGQRGFTPFGREHAKDSKHMDLKEFWHVGRDIQPEHPLSKYYPPNIWADKDVADFKETFLQLYKSLDETAVHLLRAIGKALDVPSDYFDEMVDDGNSILRLIHYPPVKNPESEVAVRAAAHEDINLITLLVGATDSGLELLDRDGQWLAVESEPGHLVVDSGDMLSRITNEVIPATTHRVVNPADDSSTRFSMPYFVHPNPEAMLSCIPSCRGEGEKYPPITGYDFLVQRLREIGLKKD